MMAGMPEPGTLTVAVESDDTAHVVRIAGELDVNTRGDVDAVLAGLSKPPLIVILEVSDLVFIDSTGLKSVLNEHRRAREAGYEFVLVGALGPVRETLRLTALDLTLPLAPDVASVIGR
jgi:anti-sigma B factor antagonist